MSLAAKLYRKNIISPKGLYTLVSSVLGSGMNLLSLLKYSARTYPKRMAVTCENASITYNDLYQQSKKTAAVLFHQYNIHPGKRIAFLCDNHLAFVQACFAASATGADIFLINPVISPQQFKDLTGNINPDLLVYDESYVRLTENINLSKTTARELLHTVNESKHLSKCPRKRSGKIVLLSSGTGGHFKTTGRKTKAGNFTNPFFALLKNAHLDRYQSVYIATPLFHGFGFAALCMSLLLGTHVFLLEKFNAAKACEMVGKSRVEVITLVPLMLKRMMQEDAQALSGVKCLLSGGASLPHSLVQESVQRYGKTLYNLYGTSEAGFTMMAGSDELLNYPGTIGKKIKGVSFAIKNNHGIKTTVNETGSLYMKTKWAVKKNSWTDTGDLAYLDQNGYCYLNGRADEMIVSGGQNVYPIELESILLQYPGVRETVVIGVQDEDYGQRLKAYVVTAENSSASTGEIFDWLTTRAARYQLPKEIVLVKEIPYNSIGKPLKQHLQ